jgi:hypothetical protein
VSDFAEVGDDAGFGVLAALILEFPAVWLPKILAKIAIPKPLRLLKIRN